MSQPYLEPPSIAAYRRLPAKAGRIDGGRRCKATVQRRSYPALPLVSIITPAFNAADTLSHALVSVLTQSYPNIELIIVDGGSVDGTLELLHSFNRGIDYWISEADDGISDAFNKGIALANGDIIGILNADDWYEPDAVEKVVVALSAEQADVVCGALQYWHSNKRGYVFYSNPANLIFEATVNHPTVFVRRSVYEQYGLFRNQYRYAMDYDMLLRLYINGVRFQTLPDILANMRLGGRSDTRVWPISKELFQIKSAYLGHPAQQALYSVYHFLRTHTSKFLREQGADRLLDEYRKQRSVVIKDRPGLH